MSDTKLCPACAEEIKAAAQKCKHCGEAVGASSPGRGPNPLAALAVIVGVGLFAYAMAMDVTVDSGTVYGRVANIHLISQQANFRNGGAFLALIGLLLGFFSKSPAGQALAVRTPATRTTVDWESKLSPQQKQIAGLVIGTVIFLSLLFVYAAAH